MLHQPIHYVSKNKHWATLTHLPTHYFAYLILEWSLKKELILCISFVFQLIPIEFKDSLLVLGNLNFILNQFSWCMVNHRVDCDYEHCVLSTGWPIQIVVIYKGSNSANTYCKVHSSSFVSLFLLNMKPLSIASPKIVYIIDCLQLL